MFFTTKLITIKVFNFNNSGDTIFLTIKHADLYKILNENLNKNVYKI